MADRNNFFRKLSTHPALIWKGGVAVIFIPTAVAMFFMYGLHDFSMGAFAGLLFLYGLYRFYTFYQELKRPDDE
jgi:hypothetical protein